MWFICMPRHTYFVPILTASLGMASGGGESAAAELRTLQILALDVVDLVLDRLKAMGDDVSEWDARDEIEPDMVRQVLYRLLHLTGGRALTLNRTISFERDFNENATVSGELGTLAKDFAHFGERVINERDTAEDGKERSEATVRRLAQRVEQQRHEYEESQKQLERSQHDLEQVIQRLRDTEQLLAAERLGRQRMRRECEQWDGKWKELEGQLHQHRATLEQNEHELQGLKQQADYFQHMLQDKIKIIADLEERLGKQSEESYDERRQLEQRYKKICAKFRETEEILASVRQSLDSSNHREQQLGRRLGFEQAQNRELSEDLQQAKQQVVVLAGKLDAACLENEAVRQQVLMHYQHSTDQQTKSPVVRAPGQKIERPMYGVVEQKDMTDYLIADLENAAQHLHEMRTLKRTPGMDKFEQQIDKFLDKIRDMMRNTEFCGSPHARTPSPKSVTVVSSRAPMSETSRSSTASEPSAGSPTDPKNSAPQTFMCKARFTFCDPKNHTDTH